MGYFQSGFERVTLEFRGSIAGTFLRYLLLAILTQLIIPTAWGTAILYRWLVKWIYFSDGTNATFEGRPGQIWGWLALSAGFGYVPEIAVSVMTGANPIAMSFDPEAFQASVEAGGPAVRAVSWALTIVILPIVFYVELVIYRWGIAGISLGGGPGLRFTGRYPNLLGWYLLTSLSLLTIIGWAWVGTAFLRWFSSKIEGAGIGFEFVGSGWGLLWRLFPLYLLIVLGAPLIALHTTLPWWAFLVMWFILGALALILIIKWLVRNTVMFKATTSPGAAPPATAPTPRAKTSPPPRKSPTPRPKPPPPVRESPPPRATTPPPKRKSPPPKNPTPPPADPPPDVPFPLVVESKYG